MSFTDGKPFVATAEECKYSWSCGPRGLYFRCYLCGYRFKVGDVVRWQFTNNIPKAGGNPLVCANCDGPDVIEKWVALCAEAKSDKFWWFRKQGAL